MTTSEQALRASETRYRRLFESAKDGILILDADSGAIIDVNPYLADLLGYTREDFIGKHIWDFGPFHDVVASKAAFDELQAQDYIAYDDLPLETSDGRQVDVGFVSNVYLVEDQRIIQCNIRDISIRKLAERTRLDLADQLRAAQKMEAIGGLASGIAHDFNNLLSVILCYTEFALQRLPDGDPIRDDLFEVEKAGQRATALTRQLLAFSRKQVLQPVPLDLNHVAENLEKMLQRILGEDVELVSKLAPDLGLTMADPGQLEQVIMNLVVNARDAMPGGGSLTIETRNVDHAGRSCVVLSVTDTGCGMDAQTRARVFEPFFTTKEADKGTGLGLSTAYGIVKQSGGDLWVESEPGRGSRFIVRLPRESSTAPTRSRTPIHGTTTRRVGSETILVVEDEVTVRELAQRILAAEGYTVLTAANGRDALALSGAHAGAIPLVLTDVVMPQVGGRMFAEQLRELRPSTKILFMSGYPGAAIDSQGMLEPGNRFLGKPFNAADLTRAVRDMLDAP
jgi:two-component system cell cycle sensor histidine kinase/response regulator CckA